MFLEQFICNFPVADRGIDIRGGGGGGYEFIHNSASYMLWLGPATCLPKKIETWGLKWRILEYISAKMWSFFCLLGPLTRGGGGRRLRPPLDPPLFKILICRFNSLSASLLLNIFLSFEVGIAHAIANFKWKENTSSLKN